MEITKYQRLTARESTNLGKVSKPPFTRPASARTSAVMVAGSDEHRGRIATQAINGRRIMVHDLRARAVEGQG